MPLCPFIPDQPAGDLKCDYLIGKEMAFKENYVREFCKGRFKDCTYYFHLSKWLERIQDALREQIEGEEDEA